MLLMGLRNKINLQGFRWKKCRDSERADRTFTHSEIAVILFETAMNYRK
jgi:hypothetical protein